VTTPTDRVTWFPVRHHSPVAARLLRDLVTGTRPAAVLVEGPSDFNPSIATLALPHRLPIAIASSVLGADGIRRGAIYPFCVWSPEWQAIRAGFAVEAEVAFIDLPWSALAEASTVAHRWGDHELRRGRALAEVCARFGADDFDDLWDTLVEVHDDLTLTDYLARAGSLCTAIRELDEGTPHVDAAREAFMAERIRDALDRLDGDIVVVTGGYHTSALRALVAEGAAPAAPPAALPEGLVALAPYAYEALDSLAGYEAGMPNPGFYDAVWADREAGRSATWERLLGRVAEDLRGRDQAVSPADLIAVATTARGLAALRGHDEPWRTDLLDGIAGALVKDELAVGAGHPLMDAVHAVFRGGARGALAKETPLPPLVVEAKRRLAELDLTPDHTDRAVRLDLTASRDLDRSRLLHALAVLGVGGIRRAGGADLTRRGELTSLVEQWRVGWSPGFEADLIAASFYGPTIAEATAARLAERARTLDRAAEPAAVLLVDACLAGVADLTGELAAKLAELLTTDPDFAGVSAALGHLVFLYRYDPVLGVRGRADLGALLGEAMDRALWLVEATTHGEGGRAVDGIAALLEAYERCADQLGRDRADLVDVLDRVAADRAQVPVVRGAALGALWTLAATGTDQVVAELAGFAVPERLGDFLTGLFRLAREVVPRRPELVGAVDQLVVGFGREEFLEALPGLRLAFSSFTPRERHHLATTLVSGAEEQPEPLTTLAVSAEAAAAVLAFEARLADTLAVHGLRHG
jgi:hypothetical protein